MPDTVELSWIYVNGELHREGERHLSALDRGFTLGDGVFETIRIVDGRPFRLAEHLARLRASAAAVRLSIAQSDEELAQGVYEVPRANGLAQAVVRLTVSRGVAVERGLLPPHRPSPTLVVQSSPFREAPPDKLARGFSACISSVRRNESSPASRAKTCSYLDNLLARLEAEQAGADEAILLNCAGYLACCSVANLHLVNGERVRTPALECGVLAGITRQVISELASPLGLEWEESWLRPSDLLAAEEAFLTNSVLGVVPLCSVDGQALGSGHPGPVTLALRRLYQDLLGQ